MLNRRRERWAWSTHFEKVTDINAIIAFGVMTTPALAVDGTVKVAGRVPTVDALKEILASA